jgi:hypothetical protein
MQQTSTTNIMKIEPQVFLQTSNIKDAKQYRIEDQRNVLFSYTNSTITETPNIVIERVQDRKKKEKTMPPID